MANTEPSVLPSDFLSGPGPNITVTRVDFSSAKLDEYKGLYAVILDNVLTLEECETLVAGAEKSSIHPEGWERAMINIGGGRQAMMSEQRNCGRIIWDSPEVVDKIWKRIEHVPEVQEIVRLENVPRIFGLGPKKRGEVWKFTRPNERMRFLKYTGGEYFRPHCDGTYETPDRKERSYFTMHLYLNTATVITPKAVNGRGWFGFLRKTASDPREAHRASVSKADGDESVLVGGATTFHPFDLTAGRKLDVLPEAGRVLLFQHRDLVHSGDDVLKGVKYTMRTDLMYELESMTS